jgi:HD superfamily phosphohydrolase
MTHGSSPYIIGNTICADLLDYARRDMRATGLNQDYDDRLYSYFDLALDESGHRRLAMRVTKDQGLRLDAVSEILHVLRMRYTLSERVLFHHTKNSASAMLGEALRVLDFATDALDELRDQEILPWVRQYAQKCKPETREFVMRLVNSLAARRLHKTVFRVDTAQQIPYHREHSTHLGSDFAVPDRRAELQRRIEAELHLKPGDVIIYCPEPQMTMKEIWVNVVARKGDQRCRPLRLEANENAPFLPGVVADEVKALEEKYRAL